MNRARLLLLLAMGALVGTFFALDLDHYLSLTQLQVHQERLALWVDRHVVAASLLFLVLYVLTTALSCRGRPAHPGGQRHLRHPVGALAGLLCQLPWRHPGLSQRRFLLRDWVETRFGDKLASVQAGMQGGASFTEPAPHPPLPLLSGQAW